MRERQWADECGDVIRVFLPATSVLFCVKVASSGQAWAAEETLNSVFFIIPFIDVFPRPGGFAVHKLGDVIVAVTQAVFVEREVPDINAHFLAQTP